MEMMKRISKYSGHIIRGFAKTFVIYNLTFLLSSCEKVLETYVGLPMQPNNINSVYVPGLNVFGVLKAGAIMDTLNHYFEVHYIPHVFDTTSNININDADITLQNDFNTYNLNNHGNGLYYNLGIDPIPGQEWNYTCVYDTFEVTSQTIIPNMPVVSENAIEINDGSIKFSIDYDASALMYDVYFIDEYSYITKRIVPEYGNNIEVQLDIEYDESSAINLLYVIAYDQKYEQYVTTSNIFFKPNAFRPRFTTVDGGYGCFGSLTSLEIDLKNIFMD
jgi:hypothetical protein